jgi:hypothetical protein
MMLVGQAMPYQGRRPRSGLSEFIALSPRRECSVLT